jgi:hypothetical protein
MHAGHHFNPRLQNFCTHLTQPCENQQTDKVMVSIVIQQRKFGQQFPMVKRPGFQLLDAHVNHDDWAIQLLHKVI